MSSGILVMFAFLAGVVTILAPCILPVLPLILSGATGRDAARLWGIVTGFVASFTFFTLSRSWLAHGPGLSADVLRLASLKTGGEHTLTLTFSGGPVELFAFTFG